MFMRKTISTLTSTPGAWNVDKMLRANKVFGSTLVGSCQVFGSKTVRNEIIPLGNILSVDAGSTQY